MHELLASAVRALIGDEAMAAPVVWLGEDTDLVWLRSVVISLTEYGEFGLGDPATIEMSRYTETAYDLALDWIDASNDVGIPRNGRRRLGVRAREWQLRGHGLPRQKVGDLTAQALELGMENHALDDRVTEPIDELAAVTAAELDAHALIDKLKAELGRP